MAKKELRYKRILQHCLATMARLKACKSLNPRPQESWTSYNFFQDNQWIFLEPVDDPHYNLSITISISTHICEGKTKHCMALFGIAHAINFRSISLPNRDGNWEARL